MGNNRSILVSGSTATTASLNSTSSLPASQTSGTRSGTLSAISNATQGGGNSSVSFLKRFRNQSASNQCRDETDNKENFIMQRKKTNKVGNTFKKKKPLNENGSAKKSSNQKKFNKKETFKLEDEVQIKSDQVGSNDAEYTSINDYIGNDLVEIKDKVDQPKQESFYESTLEMDLATQIPKQNLQARKQIYSLIDDDGLPNNGFKHTRSSSDTTANLYSEIINKQTSSRTNLGTSESSSPPIPPLLNRKSNPIISYFNKLTKTAAKQPEQSIAIKTEEQLVSPPPTVPAKAFNPSKEFYSDLILSNQTYDNCDNDAGENESIYCKIQKNINSDQAGNDRNENLPPLPTTLIPTNSLNDEVEKCLNFNDNEYQSMQEYDSIKPDQSPTLPLKSTLYSPIEPMNINNQVYYSFTSDSQENLSFQNKLQNEYISRIDVKCNDNTENKLIFKIESMRTKKPDRSELVNNLDALKERNNSITDNFSVKL